MRYKRILFLAILLLTCLLHTLKGNSIVLNKLEGRTTGDTLLLNRITNIEKRLDKFTAKDTLGGYSSHKMMRPVEPIRRRADAHLRDRNGLLIVPSNYQPFVSQFTFRDTIIVDPAMLPVVFDGKILPDSLVFGTKEISIRKKTNNYLIDRDSIVAPNLYTFNQANNSKYKLINKDETQLPALVKAKENEAIRKEFYSLHPDLIKLNALVFDNTPLEPAVVISKNPFDELLKAEKPIEIAQPEIEGYKVKQVFWKLSGENSVSVSQRAYSSSWSPSTNDNLYLQCYFNFKAQYRKNKIRFDHLIEWRFNVQYISLNKEDRDNLPNYNPYLIGDDYIRTFNTVGLQSFLKNWAYTITLEIKTPVFYKHPQDNKHKSIQGPFSPLNVNFGIGGIEYSLNKESKKVRGRKINMTVNLAPLAFNYDYVGSNAVYLYNQYGVVYEAGHPKAGERRFSKISFGSTINAQAQYNLNSYSFINSRFKYNTDYKSVKIESESTIEFKLNRFFSTKLYVYMKFNDEDQTKRDPRHGYFSVNEELGFGLSYNWNK